MTISKAMKEFEKLNAITEAYKKGEITKEVFTQAIDESVVEAKLFAQEIKMVSSRLKSRMKK